MPRAKTVYTCSQCGTEHVKWQGQCADCGGWNCLVEGLVVPPGDCAALAEALARLAGDGALRQRFGAAARQRVLAGFTIHDVQSAIHQSYARLLGPTHGPTPWHAHASRG